MKVTTQGRRLIQSFEGLCLDAYLDSGGVWTIGYGTTRYPPWYQYGRRVQQYDTCTKEQADMFMTYDLEGTEIAVDALTTENILPRHFDALCSLTYNIGVDSYRKSTLRKLVNDNPYNSDIRDQFMRWVYDNGEMVPGLKNRRKKEADFYFGLI